MLPDRRRQALAGAAAAAVLTVLAGVWSAPAGAAAPSCTPGSGAHLAGEHVSQSEVESSAGLQCADLRNADLTGVELVQADLSGALATGADFRNVRLGQADLSGAKLAGAQLGGADLTQATLTGADFSNADLADATLVQVDAADTTWTGADLTGVDASQAHLTGATFAYAKLDGADFTQADLGDTDFSHARGLTPWSQYVLLASGAAFLLLAGFSVRRAMKRRGRSAENSQPLPAQPLPSEMSAGWIPGRGRVDTLSQPAAALGAFNPINPPASATRGPAATLAIGLAGSLLAAFGLHLLVGGAIGAFSFAYDTLATTTCSGPQCAVGVDSGTLGLVGGVFVILAGMFVRARA